MNPIDRAVVGVGKLNAGTRYNIVANDAEIEERFVHLAMKHVRI